MISQYVLIFICAYVTSAAVLPSVTYMEDEDNTGLFSSKPSEILPIQPVLIYPTSKDMSYLGRSLFKDNKIIYIKLLKRKSYRPKKIRNQIDEVYSPKEIQVKNIFYVKALANGQFSHNRLKLYRLPEFYAITVYKKGQLKE